MRKLRPDSNQADLGAEDCERLADACRTMGYAAAANWARAELSIETSVASLCRWWQRQASDSLKGRLRDAVRASEEFDADLDARDLDARAAMALRAAYWDAVQSGDLPAIERMGKLVLDYAASARGAVELEIKERAQATKEKALELLREKFAAAESRLSAAKAAVERLNQSGGLTADARAEIEKAMGML